jgi:peroxiredoxin 2/4
VRCAAGGQHRQLPVPSRLVQLDSGLDELRYPVLADTTHERSRQFGVLLEDGSTLRGTFIIDPDGIVRHVSVTDQSVGRSADESLRILQALRTGELCPAGWRPGRPPLIAR